MNPAAEQFDFEKSLGTIEHYVRYAMSQSRDMQKFDSIWHPSANHSVNLPITSIVIVNLENAIRELDRLRQNLEEEKEHAKATKRLKDIVNYRRAKDTAVVGGFRNRNKGTFQICNRK